MPSGWISRKRRKLINIERDQMICAYCGKTCIPYSKDAWKNQTLDVVTLDHIVPQYELSLQHPDVVEYRKALRNPANLISVCNGCNSSKRHTPLAIWSMAKGLDYDAIVARITHQTTIAI